MGNFFQRFFKVQYYVHYALLGIIIALVAYWYGAPIDVPMTLVLIISLLIADTLIHGLFWILPKPLRWRG